MSSFSENINKNVIIAKLKVGFRNEQVNLSSKSQKGLSGKNDKHLGILLLLSHTELQSAAVSL